MLKETDYGARFELLVVVEAIDWPNGEQLVAHLEADERRDDDSITPSVIESLIKIGLARGWVPARRGSCPALNDSLRRVLAEQRAGLDPRGANSPISRLRDELLRSFGRSIQVVEERHSLRISAGTDADVDVSVAVDDPSRPSFIVCYPGFDSNAESWKELREIVSKAVLIEGVVGIVNAYVKAGAVLPEFPSPRLRRNPVRRRNRR